MSSSSSLVWCKASRLLQAFSFAIWFYVMRWIRWIVMHVFTRLAFGSFSGLLSGCVFIPLMLSLLYYPIRVDFAVARSGLCFPTFCITFLFYIFSFLCQKKKKKILLCHVYVSIFFLGTQVFFIESTINNIIFNLIEFNCDTYRFNWLNNVVLYAR